MKTSAARKNGKNNSNGHADHKRILEMIRRREEDGEIIKIDLGGGENPQPGFLNLDLRALKTVDIVHDWEDIPWPLPSECACVVMASHVVEHVNPAKFGFVNWMNEVWRILKYDGQLMITTPFAGSSGYWSDPTHINPCTHRTWEWFDPLALYAGTPSNLYRQYRPKPWRIQNNFYQLNGNNEVLLVKRHEDVSYQR